MHSQKKQYRFKSSILLLIHYDLAQLLNGKIIANEKIQKKVNSFQEIGFYLTEFNYFLRSQKGTQTFIPAINFF